MGDTYMVSASNLLSQLLKDMSMIHKMFYETVSYYIQIIQVRIEPFPGHFPKTSGIALVKLLGVLHKPSGILVSS